MSGFCGRLTVESGEAEHADLLGDVVPGPWGAQSLQLGLQLVPHQQHSVGHGLNVALPAGSRREEEGHLCPRSVRERDGSLR